MLKIPYCSGKGMFYGNCSGGSGCGKQRRCRDIAIRRFEGFSKEIDHVALLLPKYRRRIHNSLHELATGFASSTKVTYATERHTESGVQPAC